MKTIRNQFRTTQDFNQLQLNSGIIVNAIFTGNKSHREGFELAFIAKAIEANINLNKSILSEIANHLYRLMDKEILILDSENELLKFLDKLIELLPQAVNSANLKTSNIIRNINRISINLRDLYFEYVR